MSWRLPGTIISRLLVELGLSESAAALGSALVVSAGNTYIGNKAKKGGYYIEKKILGEEQADKLNAGTEQFNKEMQDSSYSTDIFVKNKKADLKKLTEQRLAEARKEWAEQDATYEARQAEWELEKAAKDAINTENSLINPVPGGAIRPPTITPGIVPGLEIDREGPSGVTPLQFENVINRNEEAQNALELGTDIDVIDEQLGLSKAAIEGQIQDIGKGKGVDLDLLINPPPVIPGISGRKVAEMIVDGASSMAEAGSVETLESLAGVIPKEIDYSFLGNNPTDTIAKTYSDIVADTVANDPDKLTFMQQMSNFYADKSLSSSDEFKEIFEVYNGKGFEPRNVIMTEDNENYIFYMYDELSKLITLKQDKSAKTLYPVYGVFGGPSSPNNALPIDTPDTVFLAHDAEYDLSYFAWEADMRLVSRLVQRRDAWPKDNITQLNNIVVYFATMGSALATIKGSISGDPSKQIIDDEVTDDIFPALNPDSLSLPKPEYIEARFIFYKELASGLEDARERSIFSAGNLRNKKLFDSINIELL